MNRSLEILPQFYQVFDGDASSPRYSGCFIAIQKWYDGRLNSNQVIHLLDMKAVSKKL